MGLLGESEGGMWVAAKFDCPTNRLEPCHLAKETLRAAIFISLTLLRIQLENFYMSSSLHHLPDHNKDYNEANDNVHLVDVAVHGDVVKCYEPLNEQQGRC